MSTTTQILFNSPALHSLKRDQLVKLCKIHRLKANGKNAELIERLKKRAQELPEEESGDEDTAEGATDVSDIETGAFGGLKEAARPSEQWEVVMEDIQETEEIGSSMGTLSSMKSFRSGEFGTSSSKCEFQVIHADSKRSRKGPESKRGPLFDDPLVLQHGMRAVAILLLFLSLL